MQDFDPTGTPETDAVGTRGHTGRRNPTHRGTYAIEFVTQREDGRRFVTDTLRCELREVVRLATGRDEDCTVIHRYGGDLVCRRRNGVWTCRDGSPATSIGGVEVTS